MEDNVFYDTPSVENEGDMSPNIEEDRVSKLRRRTINVMYFTMFVGSISFSIVMSSLWPFLIKMDDQVSETFLGWVNSGYSLAQMGFSIIFGYWCDNRPSIEPLLLSIILLAAGSGLYAYAEAFGTTGIWVVLGARILLGSSAGSISVSRAVGAHLSNSEEVAKTMSYLSMYQSVGFLIGPALQAAAKPIGSNGIYVPTAKFYFNIYTAPCYLMILLSIINFCLVWKYFNEDIDNSKCKYQEKDKQDRTDSKSYDPVDKFAIGVMLVIYFVAMSVFALNETILSPMLMTAFAWSRDATVFYGGIILSVSGVLGIICFLLIAPLSKRFSDNAIVVGALLILLFGFIIYIPWGPGYLKLTMADLKYPNRTVIHSQDDGGGCPYQYKWCHNMPRLPLPQFIVGATLVCIGFPIAVVLVSIIYSKIIGPFPQGVYMGWLSGVGSLARVLGPVYVTVMYVHVGIRWMVVCTAGIIAFAIAMLFISWKRVVPYNVTYRRLSAQSIIPRNV